MVRFFTEEELEELRRADAELDEEYHLTQEDIVFSRQLDREAKLDRLDNRGRRSAAQKAAYYEANREKIAAQQAAYYEANREKIAAQKAAYYEANREKIAAQQAAYREANREKIAAQKAAYREANREKYNAYMREYLRKRREAKKAASDGANIESGKGNKSISILTL